MRNIAATKTFPYDPFVFFYTEQCNSVIMQQHCVISDNKPGVQKRRASNTAALGSSVTFLESINYTGSYTLETNTKKIAGTLTEETNWHRVRRILAG